jgi:uroporphyrinogen decarboxylase
LIRPVLLVRPDGNETDAAALVAAGIPVLVDPYLVVSPAQNKAPGAQILVDLGAAGAGDWLVLTSPRAMDAWAALVGSDALTQAVAGARARGLCVAAVGTSTATTVNPLAELVGTSGADALADDLVKRRPGRVIFPHGQVSRPGLPDTLRAAGWTVASAVVYDTTPVTERPVSAGAVSSGNLSAVLLRSPSAVAAVGQWAEVLPGVRVVAVGPTTAEAALARGWDVVSLPVADPSKVADAVRTTLCQDIPRVVASPLTPDDHPLPPNHPLRAGLTSTSPLLVAYRGGLPERRPVWFMRQAGRSLPEYRAIREGHSMLGSCLDPELAAEITLQPVRRHDVDAAILFSDIVIPVRLAGVGVEIAPGIGPVVEHPLRTLADVRSLPELDPDALRPIHEAVGLAVAELGSTPLIGFAGAPFTVASYLVEGKPSRELPFTRALMRDDPETWHLLLAWVARTTTLFLRAQAIAGASALQLFDSWAGRLTPDEYLTGSAPHSAAVLAGVADLGLPRVHFGTGTRDLLVTMRDAGADIMGVDSDTPLDEANALLGGRTPLQGNIDPAMLSGTWDRLASHAADVVRRGHAAPGHVVNLGHGVPPSTDPDLLTRLVAHVHELPEPEPR